MAVHYSWKLKKINFLFYLLLKFIYLFFVFFFVFCFFSSISFTQPILDLHLPPLSQLSQLSTLTFAESLKATDPPKAQRHRPTPPTHAVDPRRWPTSQTHLAHVADPRYPSPKSTKGPRPKPQIQSWPMLSTHVADPFCSRCQPTLPKSQANPSPKT